MRAQRVNFGSVTTKIVPLEGGLNENTPSLELAGGELSAVKNYEILQGSGGGYTSVQGYERYDGTALASTVALDDGDDTAREARRTAIGEVPGEGAILGLHLFQDKLYAFRNHTGSVYAKMWVESLSGWTEIDTSSNLLLANGDYNFNNYIFHTSIGTDAMFWSDGKNKARYYDGTSVVVIDNAGMDPNDAPINIVAHNNRLFLAYEGGSLQSSLLGDPTDWTTASEELLLGKEITNLLSSVGNVLTIFCDEAIKNLLGTEDRDTWQLEVFSYSSGAYKHSVARLLGTLYFMDDRGVTSLAAVQEFGDFASNSLSQKVYKTIQNIKSNTTAGIVSRDKNQYRLFFNNLTGMYFSFDNKVLRGITFVRFPDAVLKAVEGEDSNGNNVMFFGSSDGYVYKLDSGTSFDGAEIDTSLSTAFYHYGSPRNWKRFQSITMEITTLSSLDISLRALFDYGESTLPSTAMVDILIDGLGGVWGEGEWGEMIYNTSSGTNRLRHYTRGLASNMALELSASSKYNSPHIIQTLITDYEVSRRQL